MRIGEVAARSGVSTRALRYYEEQELLSAERSSSGQRHYPDSAVDRVRLIQHLYAAGLASRAVRELLPCMHTGVATSDMLARLSDERDRIEQRLIELSSTRDRLDAVIRAARQTSDARPEGRSAEDGGRAAPRLATGQAPPSQR